MEAKDKLYFSHAIEVRKSGVHGYGVFSKRDISKGELIEESYAIMLSAAWEDMEEVLKSYCFAVPPLKLGLPSSMAALGHAMIYNHDESPNVDYKYIARHSIFKFIAAKDIEKDEELFIDYGENSHCVRRFENNG